MTGLADLVRKAGLEHSEPAFIDFSKLPQYADPEYHCARMERDEDSLLVDHQCTRPPNHKGRHACRHGIHDG